MTTVVDAPPTLDSTALDRATLKASVESHPAVEAAREHLHDAQAAQKLHEREGVEASNADLGRAKAAHGDAIERGESGRVGELYDRVVEAERRVARESGVQAAHVQAVAGARRMLEQAREAARVEILTDLTPAVDEAVATLRESGGRVAAALDTLDVVAAFAVRGRDLATRSHGGDGLLRGTPAPRFQHPAASLGVTEATYPQIARSLRDALEKIQEKS